MVASNKTSKIIIAVIFSVAVGYFALNAKAVYKRVQFSLKPESLQNPSELLEINKVAVKKDPSSVKAAGAATKNQPAYDLQPDWFSYPELGIKAPIFWSVSATDSNKKMNDGLTHILTTSVPGNGGEGLISGHSSHYWWQKGNYNEVFVNLPKAKNGDRFIINKNGLRVYEVTNKYEIKTNNYLEFKQSGPEIVKLMTCVPIGTNLRRLIVEAKLINVL